ncbi:hypothetical protein AQ505_02115 [Pedobacter sp. PACM 27299]|uniref:glycosyltransferase family 2 protein n=1 Tax=Pedobacter sp. PACM 27299 TaxID=1727164 RepID=UPI0007068CA3|nr:glycosyltransferase family 2 protein [Pedobacter sp. PACM 27299]ALL04398.1 hypothetical protein AQ505_02115 [Pedobacter sp. PACM 27299]
MIKKKTSQVSVITVVYNGAEIIEGTILSVLGQTYKDVEYIIIDGGSSDSTFEILDRYNDKLSHWVSEPDKGIYDAMNKGVAICSGEWVIFMNAGDSFYDENVLSNIFDYNHENSDVIYGAVNCFDKFKEVIIKPDNLLKITHKMIFCHQSSLVRRELLLNNRFDMRYKIAADYNLFYNLYANGFKFVEMPVCIANYEVGTGLSSKNGYQGAKDNLMINKNWGKPSHMVGFYYGCLSFYTRFYLKKILPYRLVRKLLLIKYNKVKTS